VDNKTGHNLSDKYLVEKVLGGNTHAFRSVIRNTERLVTQIIFKMISNPEDRKDLAQDIYIKVYNKLASFRFQSKLSTWIAQVSYNTCLDYLQKKKLILPGNIENQETADDDTDFFKNDFIEVSTTEVNIIIARKELSGILKTEIEKLSPVFRTLITLYHQEELSYDEIGQITGLPAGTIKSYLSRARKKLRDNLLVTYKKEDL
jgi:RNA polymerase sigma-70 factor (ECF subfamily)